MSKLPKLWLCEEKSDIQYYYLAHSHYKSMVKNVEVTSWRPTICGLILLIYDKIKAYLSLEFRTCSMYPLLPISLLHSNKTLKDNVVIVFKGCGSDIVTYWTASHFLLLKFHLRKGVYVFLIALKVLSLSA